MEIENQLKLLDLSDNEITVYLANLELGEATLAAIAQKSQLARTTVEYILKQLDKKGLLQELTKDNRRYFLPYPPKTVLGLLKQKEMEFHSQIETFQESLPELNRLFKAFALQPRIRVFEGEEIRNIYEEILSSPIEETWFIGEMEKTAAVVGEQYLKSWMKRRVKKHIGTKAIRVRTGEFEDEVVNAKEGYLRSVRLAPEGFESPSHIIIYGDNVAIITSPKESFGVVITSREYATTMKNCFMETWKNSTDFIHRERD